MITNVIFDYGNTLAASPSLEKALVSVFDHEKAFLIGRAIQDAIWDLYTPEQETQPDWESIWQAAFHRHHVPFEKEIGRRHLERFAAQNRLYGYTIPMLTELSAKNIRLALLGNVTGPADIFHQDLRQRGLDRFFDVISWSSEIGWRKPGRAAFQYTLDKVGCTAQNVLMVGDSEIADIGGASKLGIKTVRVYDGERPETSKADYLASREAVMDTVCAICFKDSPSKN